MKLQDNDNAVSPVIGVVLMVAITVVLAAVVFVLVGNLTAQDYNDTPQLTFDKDTETATLTLVRADSGLTWDTFAVTGCTAPTGNVTAGDTLTDCGGVVHVVYIPNNELVYHTQFYNTE